MTPTLTSTPLCRYPDRWTINDAENAVIATDDDQNFVIVPIGKIMLLKIAKKLFDIGITRSDNR